MLNQLYRVGLTYLRRPLFWVATSILLAVVVYGVSTSKHQKMQQSYPRFKASGLRIQSYEEFQNLQAEGRLQEIRTLDFMSLLGDKMRHLARWDEAMQGRAVHIDEINAQELIEECAPATEIIELIFAGLLPDLDLSWLSQFQKLRYFEILSLSGNKPWITQLEKLPELERLSITSCQSLEGLSRLAKLKNLRTLKLGNIQRFSDVDLLEIAELPELRTLILSPHQVSVSPKTHAPENSVSDAGLAVLRDMPNLQTIYVNPYALERVRSILPNKRVLRANYSKSRIANLVRVEFALALFFAVVFYQLAGQSSLPLGRLAPQFFRSHLIVPSGMLVATIALGTYCLSAGDTQMGPALSVCLLVLTGVGSLFLAMGKLDGLAGIAWAFSLAFMPLAVLVTHEHYFPSEIDAFLLGDFLGTCAAIIGLACLAIVVILHHLTQLPLRMAKSGRTVPVSLADIKNVAEANNKQNMQTHWPLKIAGNLLDRRIAHGFHGNQPAQRISLWHAATPGMGSSQKIPFTIFLASCFGFITMRQRDEPDSLLLFALVAPMVIGMLWLFFASWSWHFRLKHFSYELVRPVSRRSLRSDFFRSLIVDLGASLSLTLPLAIVVYFLYRDASLEILSLIPTLGFYSVGILIFGIGFFASIALIRKSWLVMTVLAPAYFSAIFALPFLAKVAEEKMTSSDCMRITTALGLLGFAALFFAWRRFLRIEWGKSA